MNVLKNPATSAVAAKMVAGDSGATITQDFGGRVYGYAPVKSTHWEVGMTAPLSEYFRQIQSFRDLAMAFSLIAIAIALIVFLIFVRGITRPIRQATTYAQIVSSGDLTQTLDINRGDEVGQLAGSLNQMVGRLTTIVGDIFDGASNVTAGSQALSATARELSDGSSKQAAASEQVSSSMEQMSENIRQNASSASATEQIEKALLQLDSVTQQNASASEELAGTSEELASQAEQLTTVVEFFKLARKSSSDFRPSNGRNAAQARENSAMKTAALSPRPTNSVGITILDHQEPLPIVSTANDEDFEEL